MISNTGELEREIAMEQEALGGNLAELEHQAKDLVDWRAHVRRKPLATIGVAFGAGLLAAAMGGVSSSRSGPRPGRQREFHGDADPSAARDAWEVFTGALVGAAMARVTSHVSKLLPDFGEHVDEQRQRRASKRKRRSVPAGNWDVKAGSYL